jgi:uncharacterized protein DUF6152
MTVRTFLAALLSIMTFAAGSLLAHHSFAAQYDASKSVKVTGAVTKVEWMNPHARFYLDVKDAAGNVLNWEFELGSPNSLLRLGWTRNSLKTGDSITVSGYPARDGSRVVNALDVMLGDGKKMFAGSSNTAAPTK